MLFPINSLVPSKGPNLADLLPTNVPLDSHPLAVPIAKLPSKLSSAFYGCRDCSPIRSADECSSVAETPLNVFWQDSRSGISDLTMTLQRSQIKHTNEEKFKGGKSGIFSFHKENKAIDIKN